MLAELPSVGGVNTLLGLGMALILGVFEVIQRLEGQPCIGRANGCPQKCPQGRAAVEAPAGTGLRKRWGVAKLESPPAP